MWGENWNITSHFINMEIMVYDHTYVCFISKGVQDMINLVTEEFDLAPTQYQIRHIFVLMGEMWCPRGIVSLHLTSSSNEFCRFSISTWWYVTKIRWRFRFIDAEPPSNLAHCRSICIDATLQLHRKLSGEITMCSEIGRQRNIAT